MTDQYGDPITEEALPEARVQPLGVADEAAGPSTEDAPRNVEEDADEDADDEFEDEEDEDDDQDTEDADEAGPGDQRDAGE